ncbi:PFGI-1 class ICE element type IV pilus protein PilL2 [Carnimonas bestiolae]|uniref:PFGI-1 class ICE element type IV pilus protein PilL2 n=1 Tax=Carnimonas bestiolae TaxID=3402172 RepID=UPI003EDC0A4F
MQNHALLPLGFSVALLAGCAHEQPTPPTAEQESAALAQQYPDSDALTVTAGHDAMRILTDNNGSTDEATLDQFQDSDISEDAPEENISGIKAPVPTGLTRYIVTGKDQPTHNVTDSNTAAYGDSATVPVMQGSRYSLVATKATQGQRDLLEQTVSVNIPQNQRATVSEAIDYVLRGTGYGLCPPAGRPQQILYGLPLPAAHYQLGPMPLRDAMQVLAGPAFTVQADPIARNFCYAVRDQQFVDTHERIANPHQGVSIDDPIQQAAAGQHEGVYDGDSHATTSPLDAGGAQ